MLSLTYLLSAPEREDTSPSDIKVVRDLKLCYFKPVAICFYVSYALGVAGFEINYCPLLADDRRTNYSSFLVARRTIKIFILSSISK